MKNIIEIGKKLNLNEDDLFCYGNNMAKVLKKSDLNNNSKLVLVTAINPTPYGEGKTTVSIGLNDSFWKLGKKSVAVLREPSLGPVFGMKGGATGGGRASVIPSDEINLHFTGDFHAITSANNLLAAAIDNHIYQGNSLNINPDTISFKRCLDVNDRSLRDNFNITAASEVMAIFCLAKDEEDLKRRLGNILCGYDLSGNPVYAKDLKVENAMFILLKQAFYPNLVQSLEENPVLVHGGPFANISHGCCSVNSLNLASSISDYVITEAGFGSDLGCEKFMNLLSPKTNLYPNYIVLVATVRALKYEGIENLDCHIDHLKQYQVSFCVALNKFFEDKEEDIQEIVNYCHSKGIKCIITDSYNQGGNGSLELAQEIMKVTDNLVSGQIYLYKENNSITTKIDILAKKVYHASSVEYSSEAQEKLLEIEKLGLNHYPICVAKTQYSISDDSKLLGYPKDYTLHVRDIEIRTGSEMIIILLNKIITMPGLPKNPNYQNM